MRNEEYEPLSSVAKRFLASERLTLLQYDPFEKFNQQGYAIQFYTYSGL